MSRIAGNTIAAAANMPLGDSIRIAGMISAARILQIKQGKNAGKKMAKFLLEDLDGQIPVTCFARTFENVKDYIAEDEIVFVSARRDKGSDEPALLLDDLMTAEQVVRREVAGLVVNLEGALAAEQNIERIFEVTERHKGDQHFHMDIEDNGDWFRVRSDNGVKIDEALIDDLALLVGPENLSFTRM